MVNIPLNAEVHEVSIRAGTAADATSEAAGASEVGRSPGGPAEFDRVGPRLTEVEGQVGAAGVPGLEGHPVGLRLVAGLVAEGRGPERGPPRHVADVEDDRADPEPGAHRSSRW